MVVKEKMDINVDKLDQFAREKCNVLIDHAKALIERSDIAQIASQHRINVLTAQAGASDRVEYLQTMRDAHKEMLVVLQARRDELARIASGPLTQSVRFIIENRDDEARILIDAIKRQDRELALMAGEKIEPVMHFAEAVVVGEGL